MKDIGRGSFKIVTLPVDDSYWVENDLIEVSGFDPFRGRSFNGRF
jgi:hypothetical protein